ncbi:MAG: YncE family protein [Myxococcales bacterium]
MATSYARHWTRATMHLTTLGLLGALCGCGSDAEPSPGAVNTDAARIYATISGKDEVVVIDDESHVILDTIKVGKGPAILLHSPDYKKLYSANWEDNSVSVIDTTSNEARSITVKDRPYVIALSPDGKRLYAGLNNNEIAVIDTASESVAQSFPTDELASSIIVSPDGQTLYVATGLGAGSLRAISSTDGSLIKPPIPVGSSPDWITIGKDGSKVYTLNFLSDDISVVDTASFSVAKTITTGTGSLGIIGNVTPDGSRLYVTNFGAADLIGIDTATNQVVQTIPLHGRPVGINFDPEGKRLYVTDFGPESLGESPVDGSQFLLTGMYTKTYPGQVSVFDRETGTQIGDTVTVGPGATSVVLVPAAN